MISIEYFLFAFLPDIEQHGVACVAEESADQLERRYLFSMPLEGFDYFTVSCEICELRHVYLAWLKNKRLLLIYFILLLYPSVDFRLVKAFLLWEL